MKKIGLMLTALLFSVLLCLPIGVFAQGNKDVGNNLALNVNNWCDPGAVSTTPSNAEVTFTEQGIRFENHTKSNQAYTFYRGENMGEFQIKFTLDSHLRVPSEGERYSYIYLTFLVDKTYTQENPPVAQNAVPWQTGKAYMFLQMGLTFEGVPLVTFCKTNAFVGDFGEIQQVGESSATDVSQGVHEVVLDVRNFSEEQGGKTVVGKDMTCTVNGKKAAYYRYADGPQTALGKTVDVKMSEIKGGFGICGHSDWMGGTSKKKMKNYFTVTDLGIVCYDTNPEGVVVGQLETPDFPVKALDYVAQASYDLNFPIEIKLADLFEYQGEKEIAYTVTCEGNPIGEIKNGYFLFTPTEAKNYDIDITATIGDGEAETAVNYITLRVAAEESVQPDVPSEQPSEKQGGCGGSIVGIGTGLTAALVCGGAWMIAKKKD